MQFRKKNNIVSFSETKRSHRHNSRFHRTDNIKKCNISCPIYLLLSIGLLWIFANIMFEKSALAEIQPPNQPIGTGKGIFPGRVVWVYDPDATDWGGFRDGYWWDGEHTNQKNVNEMMSQAIRELTGINNDAEAWDKLFKYFNKTHDRRNRGYKIGEKIVIKVNFIGFIWRSPNVNPTDYDMRVQKNFTNTSPQMINALLHQLVNVVGVRQGDISICDSMAYFANEYFNIIRKDFPFVNCLDHGGKFNRIQMKTSTVPLYWSCNPKKCKQDYVPVSFTRADYLINLANLNLHMGAGMELCAMNHHGSLIRLPVEEDYYDLIANSFDKQSGVYRSLVDLMGHSQIGGKTILYLIDGLYSGVYPLDIAPRQWNSDPFDGDWTSSLFASQDPVAIDSVGFDFLGAEYDDFPNKSAVDDYLREAAMANDPPSRTFYDPDHRGNVQRLESLGVYERWNNPQDKKYSGNLGTGRGIELVTVIPSIIEPEEGIMAPSAPVVKISGGFKFTEGPACDARGNIYFTDQPNNRIWKYSVDGELTVFHENPGRANGLFFDRRGNLIACADQNNQLWLIDMQGNVTVLINGYDGKKLNGPNDLWIAPDGTIYFTDPFYKRTYWNRGPMEQDGQHVYCLSPNHRELTRVIDDLQQPNGIIGTPDGQWLYVADAGAGRTYRYKINPNRTLSEKRLFAPMGSDGMTIDNRGNIYMTGKGVTVFNPQGRKIEYIDVPGRWTANVCFGGRDRRTLFITAQDSIYSLRMRVKGVQ
jgi:gluconolactonase